MKTRSIRKRTLHTKLSQSIPNYFQFLVILFHLQLNNFKRYNLVTQLIQIQFLFEPKDIFEVINVSYAHNQQVSFSFKTQNTSWMLGSVVLICFHTNIHLFLQREKGIFFDTKCSKCKQKTTFLLKYKNYQFFQRFNKRYFIKYL